MYTGISMPLLSESNRLPALQVHSQRPPPCILLNAAQGLERIQRLGSHGFQHFRHHHHHQQQQHTTQQCEHGRMKDEVPLLHGLWVLLFHPNTESTVRTGSAPHAFGSFKKAPRKSALHCCTPVNNVCPCQAAQLVAKMP